MRPGITGRCEVVHIPFGCGPGKRRSLAGRVLRRAAARGAGRGRRCAILCDPERCRCVTDGAKCGFSSIATGTTRRQHSSARTRCGQWPRAPSGASAGNANRRLPDQEILTLRAQLLGVAQCPADALRTGEDPKRNRDLRSGPERSFPLAPHAARVPTWIWSERSHHELGSCNNRLANEVLRQDNPTRMRGSI
jgi:hypothetical protein